MLAGRDAPAASSAAASTHSRLRPALARDASARRANGEHAAAGSHDVKEASPHPTTNRPKNAHVLRSIDAEKFFNLLAERVATLA